LTYLLVAHEFPPVLLNPGFAMSLAASETRTVAEISLGVAEQAAPHPLRRH